jgi:hypothetical protein
MSDDQYSVLEPGEESSEERYGELSLASGELVIYDRRDPGTWLQSDTTVSVRV